MCAAFFQAIDEVLDGVDVPTNMGCVGGGLTGIGANTWESD